MPAALGVPDPTWPCTLLRACAMSPSHARETYLCSPEAWWHLSVNFMCEPRVESVACKLERWNREPRLPASSSVSSSGPSSMSRVPSIQWEWGRTAPSLPSCFLGGITQVYLFRLVNNLLRNFFYLEGETTTFQMNAVVLYSSVLQECRKPIE